MADFTHAPKLPPHHAPPPPIRSEQDLSHRRQGPLGNMAVVPDDYVGPIPAGAVRETDYQRMVATYGNIESGESSLTFDTSDFFMDAQGASLSLLNDPAAYLAAIGDAAAFRSQYLGYMQELVKTPAGLALLEQLDGSEHATRIRRNDPGHGNYALADRVEDAYRDEQGRTNPGSGGIVRADPTATAWEKRPGEADQPWMADRPKFAFYHELVHAYHNVRGDAERDGHSHAATVTEYPHEIARTEWQTTGLGPWRGDAVTENAIRAQMGVPIRPTYSGTRYEGPDPWAQQKDDEEPPRTSPAR